MLYYILYPRCTTTTIYIILDTTISSAALSASKNVLHTCFAHKRRDTHVQIHSTINRFGHNPKIHRYRSNEWIPRRCTHTLYTVRLPRDLQIINRLRLSRFIFTRRNAFLGFYTKYIYIYYFIISLFFHSSKNTKR